MKMTKFYLNDGIDSISYCFDFPNEVKIRYKKLLKEDRELAEMIYDCLIEDGVNLYDNLTEKEFKEKIAKEYKYVNDLYRENIDII